jgi:putative cardiolipin synthase
MATLVLLAGCSTLPRNFPRPVSHALPGGKTAAPGLATDAELQRHRGQSGLLLLHDGVDAFAARAELAKSARHTIDAQYYLMRRDMTGRLFLNELLRAADRGVRVRLLVDDMHIAGQGLTGAVLDTHPNIEVRLFNPFSRKTFRGIQLLTRFGSVTRRMHNKAFIVDGGAAILGGRNIGDEYFAADPNLAFGDLDVLVTGPAVRKVSESFDSYWNSDFAYPVDVLRDGPPKSGQRAEKLREITATPAQPEAVRYLAAAGASDFSSDLRSRALRFHWGAAEIVSDQPEKLNHASTKERFHLAPRLQPYFETTRHELLIVSPYFVPTKRVTLLIRQLRERGVRVRILTNSLASTDVAIVHAGYSHHRAALLREGVELYEASGEREKRQGRRGRWLRGSSRTSLHAKSFVFDRRHVFIGSLNLDPRSLRENTEIGVVFDSPSVAREVAALFDGRVRESAFRVEMRRDFFGAKLLWKRDGEAPAVFRHEPNTRFHQRLGVWLAGLLPIESQL